MVCEHCATPIPDTSRFCSACGGAVSDPSGAGHTHTLDDASADKLELLLKNETKGEYEIHGELGRGGMAVVFEATEVELERRVAIKVLPPELTFGSGATERFKREARTAARLSHANIVPIYRISSGGALFWYAMRFVEGTSLDALLEQHARLSLEQTVEYLSQVAEALDYAHARDVIHRDIKPANVMLDEHDHALLTDFGIAKELSAGTLTASGAVIGTPFYMSPEQCTGKKITGRADQYSVAVMAYQMLSGQVPFEGDSAIEVLQKHCVAPPPPLDVLRPDLPRHAYRAIEKALAKKPEERFRSVTAFIEALAAPWDDETTTALPRRRSLARRLSQATHAVPRRKRTWLILLALTVPLGLGVGFVAVQWQNRESTTAGAGAASDPGTAVPPGRQGAAEPRAVTGEAGGTALLTVGSRPQSVISINGERMDRNPLVNVEVPAGQVELVFEVSDATGTWSYDTTVVLEEGGRHNLGRIPLVRRR